MTLEELREIVAKRNIRIPEKDEGDFLTLVRAADYAIKYVDNLPAYVHPRLLPQEDVAKTRPYTKPAPHENPLNAWSHKVRIVRIR